MGFGLVIALGVHMKFEGISDNHRSWIYEIYNSLRHILCLLDLLCRLISSCNGFQRHKFLFVSVPELFPCLRYTISGLIRTQLLRSQEDSPD
jgi:hypothetical protein